MNTNKQAGQNEDLVWYASYGSNLQEERFLCYIMGGKAIGSNKSNPGCKDKTPPRDTEEIYIESEMYFAKSSSVWDAWKSFLNSFYANNVSRVVQGGKGDTCSQGV